MTRAAYLDLASGASGDMIIAALADAGRRSQVDVQGAVADAVSSLGLHCSITFVDDERGGLACLRAEVKTDGTVHQPPRLRRAIEEADVAERPKRRALHGLEALMRAEAAVHGGDPGDVHLHELGSADTAADLIGAAVGFDTLGVSSVAAAPVPIPQGWIPSEHGDLPLPAPATLELLRGARIRGTDAEGELVTPTGAAILVAHDASFGPVPELDLAAIGVGGGTRDTDRPNVCRVLIGDRPAPAGARLEACVLLETNIDDQSPEGIGHALSSLIDDGALDAWVTPVVMKKSRPSYQLSVLVRPGDEAGACDAMFRRTTTLGIRRRELTRWALERSEARVTVGGAEVRVKIGRMGDEIVNVAPEFDDCVDAAERTSIPIKDVYAEAAELARRRLKRGS